MEWLHRPTWVAGGTGLFIISTAFGLVPSLENAYVPGILVSAWVGGGGLVLAMMNVRSSLPDPAWIAAMNAADLEAAPRALEIREDAGPLESTRWARAFSTSASTVASDARMAPTWSWAF